MWNILTTEQENKMEVQTSVINGNHLSIKNRLIQTTLTELANTEELRMRNYQVIDDDYWGETESIEVVIGKIKYNISRKVMKN
jgi:hypothetical protein